MAHTAVSVPLRGVGCFYMSINFSRVFLFPSPCGVWVVSQSSVHLNFECRFPSPCGVWVVSGTGQTVKRNMPRFPSPCGVWVVSRTAAIATGDRGFPSPCGVWVVSHRIARCIVRNGFRPLAGCGLFLHFREGILRVQCFRPLAGCGLFRQSCTFFLVQQEKELSTLLFYCIILADVYQ